MASATRQLDSVLPVNHEAERSILGAVLLDNACYLQAASLIQADDFSLDAHRRIWGHVEVLGSGGRPIDYVTLAEELGRNKELESIGGVSYLTSLTDGLPRISNLEHYIKIVRDKAVLRQIIAMSNRAVCQAVAQTEPCEDVLETIQQGIIDILFRNAGGGVDWLQAGLQTVNNFTKRRSQEGTCIGAPTGLAELDVLTTGYREREFYAIGARPGHGKTAYMCQAVKAQVEAGWRPGIFSIEVDREQILTRLACMVSGVSVFDTRDPRTMDMTACNNFREAAYSVSEWPLFFEDGRMTPKKLAAIARLWVSKGCNCIWVDYLGKLATRAPGKTEYERVTATADALWELARFVGVPVVALCQLKRLDGQEPTLEDFRSSGEIEQGANAAIMIHRPGTEDDEGRYHWTGDDKFIIAKQRSGPSGKHIKVRFNGPVGLFEPR